VMEAARRVLAGLCSGQDLARDEHHRSREARPWPRASRSAATREDCPVSGGCHRAATEISISPAGSRASLRGVTAGVSIIESEDLEPHTGSVGSASMLKVLTNYLVHGASCGPRRAPQSTRWPASDITRPRAIRIYPEN